MGRPIVNEAEAEARAWDERTILTSLADDTNTAVNELRHAAVHAAQLLDNPRMSHPWLAGKRAELLSACVATGAVAIGREG